MGEFLLEKDNITKYKIYLNANKKECIIFFNDNKLTKH